MSNFRSFLDCLAEYVLWQDDESDERTETLAYWAKRAEEEFNKLMEGE